MLWNQERLHAIEIPAKGAHQTGESPGRHFDPVGMQVGRMGSEPFIEAPLGPGELE